LLSENPPSFGFHRNTVLYQEKEAGSDSELRRMCVGFNGHDKPFPTWYPYILVGGIAAVATALYVFG
jgi:hypothetical protein